MATTNFGQLQTEQKLAWGKELWKVARNNSFMMQFAGTGSNSMIQRITELKKTEKGARAVFQLVADLVEDGITGDYTLEGNEESISAFDQFILIDQLRHANRLAGRMADQKSVISFRETSRDVLGYWLAERLDQMAFLILSGVSLAYKTNGAARASRATGMNLKDLEFASTSDAKFGITAPSTYRHRRWSSTSGLVAGATASVASTDTPSYKMLVEAKAYAKDHYIRGIKGPGGQEYFHVFMTPQGVANLKLDADYLANVRSAGIRGDSNTLFTGAVANVDGLIIHEFRHVFNTTGLASGSKWGSGGLVDGQRVLLCGAQALAFADLGAPFWDERDHFDYGNQYGISIGKVIGYKKPVFRSPVTNTNEDFGVLAIDTAI